MILKKSRHLKTCTYFVTFQGTNEACDPIWSHWGTLFLGNWSKEHLLNTSKAWVWKCGAIGGPELLISHHIAKDPATRSHQISTAWYLFVRVRQTGYNAGIYFIRYGDMLFTVNKQFWNTSICFVIFSATRRHQWSRMKLQEHHLFGELVKGTSIWHLHSMGMKVRNDGEHYVLN